MAQSSSRRALIVLASSLPGVTIIAGAWVSAPFFDIRSAIVCAGAVVASLAVRHLLDRRAPLSQPAVASEPPLPVVASPALIPATPCAWAAEGAAQAQADGKKVQQLRSFFAVADAQLRSIVEQTTEAALSILQRLQSLDRTLREMKSTLGSTRERMQVIAEAGLQTDRKVIDLVRGYVRSRSDDIENERKQLGQIVDQMKGLKSLTQSLDQIGAATNMLSINATIEAERAGERGAGFKVVASEIRTLSQQSRSAVRDANSAIESTQNAVEGVLLGARSDEQRQKEAATINEILTQIDNVAEAYQQLLSEQQNLVAGSDSERAVISDAVLDTLGRIQFQDVVRQQVEAIAEGLQTLEKFLVSEQSGEQADATAKDLVSEVFQRYVTNIQRATHASAVGQAASTSSVQDIELF